MSEQKVLLSNAGLVAYSGETFFHFASRAARALELRGDISMAQRWRDARWDTKQSLARNFAE
jgi:hypothetical protein